MLYSVESIHWLSWQKESIGHFFAEGIPLGGNEFGKYYSEGKGRSTKPIRLMVVLYYLKHTYSESEESVVEQFIEDPYFEEIPSRLAIFYWI
ncbi:MAG: hypothetical protein H0Z29_11685 [Candidatus Marinimicrobia bacterium]|nr:hypothetical protein [Candidatus Neomarinimicrobiota bacterium]